MFKILNTALETKLLLELTSSFYSSSFFIMILHVSHSHSVQKHLSSAHTGSNSSITQWPLITCTQLHLGNSNVFTTRSYLSLLVTSIATWKFICVPPTLCHQQSLEYQCTNAFFPWYFPYISSWERLKNLTFNSFYMTCWIVCAYYCCSP